MQVVVVHYTLPLGLSGVKPVVMVVTPVTYSTGFTEEVKAAVVVSVETFPCPLTSLNAQ